MKSNQPIAIIDYGVGNLYSLTKAFDHCDANVIVTDDPEVILRTSAIVLPGVGSFKAGMDGLHVRGLTQVVKDFAASGRPILGICLGAQILLSKGYEFGEHEGLGLIHGKVEKFPESVARSGKIPHINWNAVFPPTPSKWDQTILSGIRENANVYFVHSYILIPEKPENILALAEYGGLSFCAAVREGNIYGTQFHPEKSGEVGLTIINKFINLAVHG